MTTIRFDRSGESGNIFFILAKVREAMANERRIMDFYECYDRVKVSKSYDDALDVIREYVNLEEE